MDKETVSNCKDLLKDHSISPMKALVFVLQRLSEESEKERPEDLLETYLAALAEESAIDEETEDSEEEVP